MLFALSTSHEIGLAATGAIFIIFALASSFLFPRLNPNFPGKKGLRWYIPLCFVFFIAMMSSVLYFGREQSVAEATPGHPASSGNAAAGKALFISTGCGACHTFTPAATTGKIGPNLDLLESYANKAGQPSRTSLPGRSSIPRRSTRSAGLPHERDAGHVWQIAEHLPGRRSGRVPQLEVAAPRARRGLRYDLPALEKWPSG